MVGIKRILLLFAPKTELIILELYSKQSSELGSEQIFWQIVIQGRSCLLNKKIP